MSRFDLEFDPEKITEHGAHVTFFCRVLDEEGCECFIHPVVIGLEFLMQLKQEKDWKEKLAKIAVARTRGEIAKREKSGNFTMNDRFEISHRKYRL